jgi:beta-glucosidase
LDRTTLESADVLNVSVDVANTGNRAGREVVQLYVSDLVAGMVPPVKKLRGFQKISLQPGEIKTVDFQLPMRNLSFVDRNNQWILEPGEFKVRIGGLSKRFFLRTPTSRPLAP